MFAVSLLDDRTTDTLTVTPEVEIVDDRRNPMRVPGPTSVDVDGRLQPVSAEETAVEGQLVSTLYRFICRDFPAGPWAAVTGGGRDWDVVGEPERRNGSERTRHVTVLLRGREPLAVPNG